MIRGMMRRPTIMHVLVTALALMVTAPVPLADDDDDHDLARRLLSEGKVRPLNEVMEKLKTEVPGEMLEVDFETDNGVLRYEFKILRPNGKVEEVEVDATNGNVLKIEDDD
jgi:uncharacterized membrane protein YkoI